MFRDALSVGVKHMFAWDALQIDMLLLLAAPIFVMVSVSPLFSIIGPPMPEGLHLTENVGSSLLASHRIVVRLVKLRIP